MSNPSRRALISRKTKQPSHRNRILRAESLEPRELLSGSGWPGAFIAVDAPKSADPIDFKAGSMNAADMPSGGATSGSLSFVKTPSIVGVTGSTIKETAASLAVLGAESVGQSTLTYSWKLVSGPQGGLATFSANGTSAALNTTAIFSKCGVYQLQSTITDPSGNSVQSTISVTVAQALTSVVVSTSNSNTVLSSTSAYAVNGSSQGVTCQAFDQFGNAMTSSLAWNWATTSAPKGAKTKITASGGSAVYSFPKGGAYGGSVTVIGGSQSVSAAFKFNVVSQAASISVSQVGGTANVTTTTAQIAIGQLLDQFQNPITSGITYSWTATTLPSGVAAPSFSRSGTTTTVMFHAAGAYVLKLAATAGSVSASTTISMTVVQVPTKISSTPAPITVTTATAILPTATLLDQFGNLEPSSIKTTWSIAQTPAGAPAVQLSGSGNALQATFGAAGAYVFTDTISGGLSYNVTANVVQTLTAIDITPQVSSLAGGATQQFAAQAVDQFGKAISSATIVWSATGGTLTSTGLFTAPSASGTASVKATSGSLTATATITITAGSTGGGGSNFLGLGDSSLASLVKSLDASGSITRNDMLQIFSAVDGNGTLSSTDFADLKTILADAAQLNMPNYVQVLSHDVILGNTANATYLGAPLGNLAVGSSATKLNELVSKWFLGTDLPTTTSSSYTYALASGSLFPTTPSHADEYQGEVGDCYFISTLGMIADINPTAIENMFINNGDGTYTVRFYGGAYGGSSNSDGSINDGFASGQGVADYVTVNLMLPSSGGTFIYANYTHSLSNANNSLWLPLAEKAYAQWNQTGNEGRDGSNTYNGISGGWMGVVNAQVLGYNATDFYSLTNSNEIDAIDALNSKLPLTMATNAGTVGGGLYNSHAYGVIAYNATTATFTLYNPWGFDQPSQLTWSQLESYCDGFTIASPTSPTAGEMPAPGTVGAIAASDASQSSDASAIASLAATVDRSNSTSGMSSSPSATLPGSVPGTVPTATRSATLPASWGDLALLQTNGNSGLLDARSVDAVFASLDMAVELSS